VVVRSLTESLVSDLVNYLKLRKDSPFPHQRRGETLVMKEGRGKGIYFIFCLKMVKKCPDAPL